jgi:hypothetical protein
MLSFISELAVKVMLLPPSCWRKLQQGGLKTNGVDAPQACLRQGRRKFHPPSLQTRMTADAASPAELVITSVV